MSLRLQVRVKVVARLNLESIIVELYILVDLVYDWFLNIMVPLFNRITLDAKLLHHFFATKSDCVRNCDLTFLLVKMSS